MANSEWGSFAGGMAGGVQELGRSYLQTQTQMQALRQAEAKAAQDESYRKVGIGFKMLQAIKDPEVKRQIFEKYILAETDGVLDGIDLSDAFIDQAVKDLGTAYDARQKGDINDQQLFEIYQTIRQEHPSSEAAKIAHEGLKGQIAQTGERQEELRSFLDKGWTETEYPGAQEMRFPSLNRTLYAPGEKARTGVLGQYDEAIKGGYTGTITDWKKELAKAGRTTIDIDLSKTTQTQLEKDVIKAETQIETFNAIEKGFKDEYLTIPGRLRGKIEILADKLGMPIDKKWLADRQRWYQKAKASFLAYRKWVTGVAGGEKEMAEIAKSYPDPDKNSPTQFRANLQSARVMALKLAKRYRLLLDAGLSSKEAKNRLQKGQGIPLANITLTSEEMAEDQGKQRYKYNPETGRLE